MKLSGKQLTTAVLIGLMGISTGGVVMAKPPIVQSQPDTTGQPDPAKTTDELIAEIQTI